MKKTKKSEISEEIIIVKKGLALLKGGDQGGGTTPPQIIKPGCVCTPPAIATYCDNAS